MGLTEALGAAGVLPAARLVHHAAERVHSQAGKQARKREGEGSLGSVQACEQWVLVVGLSGAAACRYVQAGISCMRQC